MTTKRDRDTPLLARAGESALAIAAPRLGKTERWQQRERLKGLLFLVPAAVYVVVFYVYPILYNLWMSLTRYTARSFVTGEAPFVGFDNFRRLISNPDFPRIMLNTLEFTVGSIFFQFTLGLAMALFFQQRFPLSGLVRSLILMPWLAPVLVSGAVWVRLFDMDYGVINFVCRSLGVASAPIAWLTDPRLALLSVTIANIWIGIPFNMVILYGGLQAIPTTLYEAAALDGASPWQQFAHISWPLLRPVSAVVLLLGLVYTVKVFDVIMSITRGGPANVSQTLNTWAYSLSFVTLDFGLAAAAGDILIAIVLVVGLFYLRYAYRAEQEPGR